MARDPAKELIFYLEPDGDRWFPGDRYPRRVIRRLVRGEEMTGHRRLLASLRLGFDTIGKRYEFNNFKALDPRGERPIGLLGKRFVLESWRWGNPMVCGPAMLDHPKQQPDLFERYNAKLYLVAGPWVKTLFEPYFGDRVKVWPIGIDTAYWADVTENSKSTDFLIYIKFLWNQDRNRVEILEPILQELERRSLTWETITAGSYAPAEYLTKLRRARFLIFLCEHETQGQAYQEALSCNVPVLAWDQGIWLDPLASQYERDSVAASSVPYFDERCGIRFRRIRDFQSSLEAFLVGSYQPREYILAKLDLASSAQSYVDYLHQAAN